MDFKANFTSLKSFVFLYISFRLFIEGFEEFLIQPTAWYYMNFLGKSDAFLGYTLAAYSAGALLFAPFVGVLEMKFQASKVLTVMCAFVRFFGNLLYSIPINGYFPLLGRFICGLGAGTEGILFGTMTKGTTDKNRAKAFLYLEGLYSLGTICGPIFGSVLTFNINIYGWQINAGNSPGFILMFIWLALLLFAMFLPNDFAENSANERSVITDSDTEPALSKSAAEQGSKGSPLSSRSRGENSVEDGDCDDDINLSKSLAELGCPPSSTVLCLYYLIFLSWFVYVAVSFYVPLLAKYHLGLELVHVKLVYLNCTLFAFVLFLVTPLFLRFIRETCFLFVSIFSQIVPISVIFYFGLHWDSTISVNAGSYLLLCSMLFVSLQLLNCPVASSWLSKLTSVRSASFYQSLTFTAVHVGFCLSRLTAGATFDKMPIIYACVGIAFCWLFALMWLGYEYRKFNRVTK